MPLFKPTATHPASLQQSGASLRLHLRLLRRLRLILHAMSVDILDPHYRPSWRLVVMYTDIVSFLLCQAYTVYVLRSQPAEILQCVCVIGIPLRGFLSTSALWRQHRPLLRLAGLCEGLHRSASGRTAAVVLLWTQRISRAFGLIAATYGMAGVAIAAFPAVWYAIRGERVLMLAILVPGLDVKSLTGFWIVSLYELFCSYLSVGILLGVDALFVVMSLMACAHVQTVRVKCEQLAEWLEETEMEGDGEDDEEGIRNAGFCPTARRLLLDTIIVGQRADQFVRELCECFEAICGWQIALSGIALAMCMLAGRVTQFLMAYPLAMALLYQIFSYSVVGSALEVQNEAVLLALAEVRWDRLRVVERRLFVVMVLRWQRPRSVVMFGSVKLNVATAMRILKTLYSGYMMLDSTL